MILSKLIAYSIRKKFIYFLCKTKTSKSMNSGGADHEFAGAREFAGTREFAGEIPDFRDLAPANSRV